MTVRKRGKSVSNSFTRIEIESVIRHMRLNTFSDLSEKPLLKVYGKFIRMKQKLDGQVIPKSRVHRKLEDLQVAKIKRELLLGRTVGSLSVEYKVSWTTVQSIRDERTWKHIEPLPIDQLGSISVKESM